MSQRHGVEGAGINRNSHILLLIRSAVLPTQNGNHGRAVAAFAHDFKSVGKLILNCTFTNYYTICRENVKPFYAPKRIFQYNSAVRGVEEDEREAFCPRFREKSVRLHAVGAGAFLHAGGLNVLRNDMIRRAVVLDKVAGRRCRSESASMPS